LRGLISEHDTEKKAIKTVPDEEARPGKQMVM
jgi:hypothetical protein